MRLSDLQNKDVVDISSGDKVGNVIDAEISNQGTIMKIIINDKKEHEVVVHFIAG